MMMMNDQIRTDQVKPSRRRSSMMRATSIVGAEAMELSSPGWPPCVGGRLRFAAIIGGGRDGVKLWDLAHSAGSARDRRYIVRDANRSADFGRHRDARDPRHAARRRVLDGARRRPQARQRHHALSHLVP